jgi:hypothetical protein
MEVDISNSNINHVDSTIQDDSTHSAGVTSTNNIVNNTMLTPLLETKLVTSQQVNNEQPNAAKTIPENVEKKSYLNITINGTTLELHHIFAIVWTLLAIICLLMPQFLPMIGILVWFVCFGFGIYQAIYTITTGDKCTNCSNTRKI